MMENKQPIPHESTVEMAQGNGDGKVTEDEFKGILKSLLSEEKSRKYYKIFALVAFVSFAAMLVLSIGSPALALNLSRKSSSSSSETGGGIVVIEGLQPLPEVERRLRENQGNRGNRKRRKQRARHHDLARTGTVPYKVIRKAIEANSGNEAKLKLRVKSALLRQNQVPWQVRGSEYLLDIDTESMLVETVTEVDTTKSLDVRGTKVYDPEDSTKEHRFDITCNQGEKNCDVFSYDKTEATVKSGGRSLVEEKTNFYEHDRHLQEEATGCAETGGISFYNSWCQENFFGLPHCDLEQDNCVECLYDNQCDSGLCVDGQCNSCSSDSDCGDEFPYCDDSKCVQCRSDSQCSQYFPVCVEQTCERCRIDADCNKPWFLGKPFCTDDSCVECQNDSHCGNGQVCGDYGTCGVERIDECFGMDSTVQVENNGHVSISLLKVGDRVLTKSGTYITVYGFAHRNVESSTHFLRLSTKETSITMTPTHMVFLAGKSNPVQASNVKKGDHLLLQGHIESIVVSIEEITKQGAIGPMTEDGTIVVDGVVASTYCNDPLSLASEFVEIGGIKMISFQNYIHVVKTIPRLFSLYVVKAITPLFSLHGGTMNFKPSFDAKNFESVDVKIAMNIYYKAEQMGAQRALMGASFMFSLPFFILEQLISKVGAFAALTFHFAAYYICKKNNVNTKVKFQPKSLQTHVFTLRKD